MTKKEMAIEVATEMKKIREDVEIERMANVLMKGMTTSELEAALNGYKRNR